MRSSIWLCWNHFPSWVAQPNFGGTWSVVSYYHIISSYCIISVMYLIVSYCNVFHLISVLFSRDCEDLIRDRIIGLPGEFSYIISTPIIITNLVIMMKMIWGWLVCYQNTIILFFFSSFSLLLNSVQLLFLWFTLCCFLFVFSHTLYNYGIVDYKGSFSHSSKLLTTWQREGWIYSDKRSSPERELRSFPPG